MLWGNRTSMADDESKNSIAKKSNRYSVFVLADKFYGLELLSVKEVISMPKISRIPNVPEHILGVFNLRGTIITLMDLNKMLGTTSQPVNENNMVIVVENDGLNVGILVDRVLDLINVMESDIKSSELEMSPQMVEYTKGYYVKESLGTIFLLNLEKILAPDKFTFSDIS